MLRPTWHYVTADDLVWLVDVTASGAGRPIVQQLRSGHDDAALDRLRESVLTGLAGTHLTRPERGPSCWSSPGGRSAATT